MPAIHEYQRVPLAAEEERRERRALDVAARRRDVQVVVLDDRRDAREVPVLVLRRREAKSAERLERRGPKRLDVGRRRRAVPFDQGAKRILEWRRRRRQSVDRGLRGHALTPTGSPSMGQSYPFSSSASASSFPPDLTI